jgi:hypothetical protein
MMVIELKEIKDERNFARFTWNDKVTDMDMLTVGIEDDVIDAMIAAKAHEGVDFPGYICTIN